MGTKLGTMTAALAVSLTTAVMLAPASVLANHPVLLEGNNAADGAPGILAVPPGTAGDYDGDGRVGTAEDADGPNDRIFGTLTAALAAANSGANGNGHVIIVTSGRFGEPVRLGTGGQPLNGVTIIEAAPGVHANIDAVISGDPGNAARQAQPGILINTDRTDRVVILRNLAVRNWTHGLQIQGTARVTVENCRFDSNIVANVAAEGSARLTMSNCQVHAAGMRFTAAGQSPPSPGNGVEFRDNAGGCVFQTTVSGSVSSGIINLGSALVRLQDNNICDNGRDVEGRIDLPRGF